MIRLGMNKSRKVWKQSWPVAGSLIKGWSLLCDAHSTRAFCRYTWDVWSVCSWENKWWDRGKSTARPPDSPDLEISLCDVPWRISCMISVSLTLISWGQNRRFTRRSHPGDAERRVAGSLICVLCPRGVSRWGINLGAAGPLGQQGCNLPEILENLKNIWTKPYGGRYVHSLKSMN